MIYFPLKMESVDPYPADHDYCRFNQIYKSTKSLLLRMKCVHKYQDLLIFVLKWNEYE